MSARSLRCIKILGNKVVIDTSISQDDERSLILTDPIADVHRPTLKAIVKMIGEEVKNPILKVNQTVLVKNFVGAPKIDIDGTTFRLYDFENILAIL